MSVINEVFANSVNTAFKFVYSIAILFSHSCLYLYKVLSANFLLVLNYHSLLLSCSILFSFLTSAVMVGRLVSLAMNTALSCPVRVFMGGGVTGLGPSIKNVVSRKSKEPEKKTIYLWIVISFNTVIQSFPKCEFPFYFDKTNTYNKYILYQFAKYY